MSKITVIGSGYVGLVHAVCLAEVSHQVIVQDIDEQKIALLKGGKAPFFEPGLDQMLEKNSLQFTSDITEAIHFSDIYFICVATPSNADGSANLEALFSACDTVAQQTKKDALIVIKSTTPPGTAKKVLDRVKQIRPQLTIDVLSNPEFLQEGLAITNCLKPDRIIIGHNNKSAASQLTQIYAPFGVEKKRILQVSLECAEMTKYAANFMLAARISTINEITRLCEAAGANIGSVKQGLSLDPRIGDKYLNPGIGFGGSCFPKDLSALIYFAKESGVEVDLCQAVKKGNNRLIAHFVGKITNHFQTRNLSGLTFAIWGISYKGGTGDIRGSPAIEIVSTLLQLNANISIFDPLAAENGKKVLDHPNLRWKNDPISSAKECDALCLLSDHNEFKVVDYQTLKSEMRAPLIFDGRNFLSKEQLIMLEFTYFGMGIEWNHSKQEVGCYAHS